VVSTSDCSVTRPKLCLPPQPLQYNTALGTGCASLLQCPGRLSLPPSVGRLNEHRLKGWVTVRMVKMDVDGSCQFSADSQPKSIGLVWWLVATRHSVYIHYKKRVDSHNDCGHGDSTTNIIVVIITNTIIVDAIHTRLTALCPGLPRWAGNRKVKPIWILLKQETVSGSGISWAICKSAHRSRQMTMPATPPLSFFTARMPFLMPNQQCQSTEGTKKVPFSSL